MESIRETGRQPNTSPFAPAGYEIRYCEGELRLDDNSTVHLFIMVTGKAGADEPAIEAMDTCWSDARFPRIVEGCDNDMAPSRR